MTKRKWRFFIVLLIGSVATSTLTVLLGIRVTSEYLPSWLVDPLFILLYLFWGSVLHASAKAAR